MIAFIRNEAARQLTTQYIEGHWSYQCTDRGVLSGMKENSKVLAVKDEGAIVGTLRITTQKPWAIDVAYFTKVIQPLYLVDMAIHPGWQRQGVGTYMLEKVKALAIAWPAQAIRLDAYNHEAGAGDFYRKCGYKERGRVVYRNTPLIYFELLINQ